MGVPAQFAGNVNRNRVGADPGAKSPTPPKRRSWAAGVGGPPDGQATASTVESASRNRLLKSARSVLAPAYSSSVTVEPRSKYSPRISSGVPDYQGNSSLRFLQKCALTRPTSDVEQRRIRLSRPAGPLCRSQPAEPYDSQGAVVLSCHLLYQTRQALRLRGRVRVGPG